MTNNFLQKPEPWAVEARDCHSCKEETRHQYIARRSLWLCLECGMVWRTKENLARIREEVAGLTSEDIWEG